MAKRKVKSTINSNKVNGIVDKISNMMDMNYKNTYFSAPDTSKSLDFVKRQIDMSVDNITKNNMKNIGNSSLTSLFARVSHKDLNDPELLKKTKELFEDNQTMEGLMAQYMNNKYVKEYHDEIDCLLKYMPQLEDALVIKQDNILSADDLSKDFLYIKDSSITDSEVQLLDQRVDDMKDKYDLLNLIEEIYMNTSKYGEQFVYVKKYSEELEDLLDKKSTVLSSNSLKFHEGVLTESVSDKVTNIQLEGFNKESVQGINMNFEMVREDFVFESVNSRRKQNHIQTTTFSTDTIEATNKELSDGGLQSADGLVSTVKDKSSNRGKLKVNGAIVRLLDSEKIIPIYIEDMPVGYYYVDYEVEGMMEMVQSMHDPTMSLKQNSKKLSDMEMERDKMLGTLAQKVSDNIDKNFINANQDLKKEIYLIMKYAQNMYQTNGEGTSSINFKIKFIPADDIFHFYFKKDKHTHRGISDLHRAIMPAKLYTSLIISNALGVLTRGNDKRVYYVKQGIDTNISQLLLNTINAIKKSNFGMREVNSLKTILNITGQYNDYIIPTGPNGSPIEFEIMPGQDIPIKTELLEILEQQSINSTDVPYDIVQTKNSVDYAERLVQTNIRFLKVLIRRQSREQALLSPFLSKIYEYEYNEKRNLKACLPPPAHQHSLNLDKLLQEAIDCAEKLGDLEYGKSPSEEEELEKEFFVAEYAKSQLGTLLNSNIIEQSKAKAKIKAAVKKKKQEL